MSAFGSVFGSAFGSAFGSVFGSAFGSAKNMSIRQKRQSQRKQIRREYIEKFTKNKRKQLLSHKDYYSSSYTCKDKSQIETEYCNYLETISFQNFVVDPNNHLQMFRQITLSQNAQVFKDKFRLMLTIVHDFLIQRLTEQINNIQHLKQVLIKQGIAQDCMFHDLVKKTLAYNQVFFEPYSHPPQYFQQDNKYNPLKSQNNQDSCIEINQPYSNNGPKSKVNILLLLQFFTAITYEITPDIFAHAIRPVDNKFSNGYDNLLIDQNHDIQFADKGQIYEKGISQFIRLYDDIYEFVVTVTNIAMKIQYQTGTLNALSSLLRKVYTNGYYSQFNLPILSFDVQKMFIKQSLRENISLRSLQIIQNLTALTSLNSKFDDFIYRKIILTQFQIFSKQFHLTKQQIKHLGDIYCNLIEGEIQWYNYLLQKPNYQPNPNEYQIDEETQFVDNNHILRQPPGVYLNLLSLMLEYAEELSPINQITYILVKILENYKIPTLDKGQKLLKDSEFRKKECTQLILQIWNCQELVCIVQSLFNKLSTEQYEIQYLSDLFVLVARKLLSHMNYLHKINQILGLVVRNQNKRMLAIETKIKSNKIPENSEQIQNQMRIASQTSKKQCKIVKQNIKKTICECSNILRLYARQYKKFGKQNSFAPIKLNYSAQNNCPSFIKEIISLWSQNQLQECSTQFAEFIRKASKYFPEHIILLKESKQNEKFLAILEQIGSSQNSQGIFIKILQNTYDYLISVFERPDKSNASMVLQYIIQFRTEWSNIMQHLEGTLYKSKSQECIKYQPQDFQDQQQQQNRLLPAHSVEKNQNSQILYECFQNLINKAFQYMDLQV